MNKFDCIELNLDELFAKIKSKKKYNTVYRPAIINIARMYFFGALLKVGIYQRLVYGNFILNWFEEFRKFWIEYLSGRPIDVIDFHYLKSLYRSKFQNVEHGNENDKKNFLEAWQKHENIHILFHTIWYHAKTAYLSFYPFLKYLPKKGRILEYGCGIAPITQGLLKYQPHRKYEFTIADIIQINFLYAVYRLGNYKNVEYLILAPYENCIKKAVHYDVIICSAVFEHLPNPLEVVADFYESLKPGGMLIFDFIKGQSEGLDTKKAVEERSAVLEYIKKNFKVVYGEIKINESMGLTVVKKIT